MTKLPTTDVYGRRSSLRTGRIDKPSTAGVELSEAYTDAVQSFSDLYSQNVKKKRDLNYTLARNEIMIAEMEERAALSEDTDWKTHGQRYGENLKPRIEGIRSKYELDPYDAQLLDAETRMLLAKGNIDVAARARGLEVDQGYAGMLAGLEEFKERIAVAPTGDRNTLMGAALETIKVAEENGYFGAEGATEAETLYQQTAQSMAISALDSMPAAEQKAKIEASLGYRRGYGVGGEFAPLIKAAADKHGIPADLLVAQGFTESSMDPDAVSPKGAVGVMQLGELTAKEMGVTDRTDPAQNIDAGAAYLAKMLKRFDGDKAKALAAYNMGPGALLDVMDEHGEDWQAALGPGYYEETAGYLKKLLPVWEGTAKPPKYLTATNTGQGPLTPEDIAAGKGTGYITDFLHTDTLAKRLEAVSKEDKENTERMEAQAVNDRARELYPDDYDMQRKYVKENTTGDVRKKAETDLDLERSRDDTARRQEADDAFDSYAQQIMNSREAARQSGKYGQMFSMNDVDPEHLNLMSAGQIRALEASIQQAAIDAQHAPVTQYVDPGDGGMSLDKWLEMPSFGDKDSKISENLDSPKWRTVLNRDDWYRAYGMQQTLKELMNKDVDIPNVGPRVEVALRAIEYGGIKNADERKAIKSQLQMRLEHDVGKLQQAKVPPTKLSDTEIDKILAGYMLEEAYFEKDYLWGVFKSKKETITGPALNEEELQFAYLPYEQAEQDIISGGEYDGMNYADVLLQISKGLPGVPDEGASKRDIERAYFAWKRGYGPAAVESRLRGE